MAAEIARQIAGPLDRANLPRRWRISGSVVGDSGSGLGFSHAFTVITPFARRGVSRRACQEPSTQANLGGHPGFLVADSPVRR